MHIFIDFYVIIVISNHWEANLKSKQAIATPIAIKGVKG